VYESPQYFARPCFVNIKKLEIFKKPRKVICGMNEGRGEGGRAELGRVGDTQTLQHRGNGPEKFLHHLLILQYKGCHTNIILLIRYRTILLRIYAGFVQLFHLTLKHRVNGPEKLFHHLLIYNTRDALRISFYWLFF